MKSRKQMTFVNLEYADHDNMSASIFTQTKNTPIPLITDDAKAINLTKKSEQ